MKKTAFTLFIPYLFLSAIVYGQHDLFEADAELQVLSTEFSFTEGPAVNAKGHVYFTDQPNDRIMKWTPEEGITTFMQPAGRANGLYFTDDGMLLACADDRNELWLITPDKEVEVLVGDYQGKRLNGPNDVWVDPRGGIYFTDPFYKRKYWEHDEKEIEQERVYYLSPNRKTLEIAADGLVKPNGIIGTSDGKYLYVADIGDEKTYRYDIGKNGRLINRVLFTEMGSDGMTMDEQGNVYLTGKGVTVFNPQGDQIAHIQVDRGWTANVCFGGPDHNLLFITAMDGVFVLEMKVSGE